jgi:hypothetical protein
MEKCQQKKLLYNSITKRCYKPCEQKNKVTHPVTKKCRQPCKKDKIRRSEDFRCVTHNKTLKKKAQRPAQAQRAKSPAPAPEQVSTVQLIPPPLKQELVKNFSFLDKLLQKGQGIKAVDYKSSSRVSEIITIYFFKKYKQTCPIYAIKTYSEFETAQLKQYYKKHAKTHTQAQLKQHLLQKQKAEYVEWDKNKFLANLKLCLETGEQLIIIPVRVPSHLNMLFIKVATREVIRFEPHGAEYRGGAKADDTNINTFLANLTKDINAELKLTGDKKFTYKAPSEICPRNPQTGFYLGFQSMEGRQQKPDPKREAKGFCLLWSWFFAECVMANPGMDIKEVYKEAWDVLKNNEGGFATIIRGYFLSINEELVKMNKTFRIHSDYITENPYNNDAYLAYLNEEREHLQRKPRKVFQDGGLKNANFILPAANPKVKPIVL